jgi:dihydrodipicolinate synthase/N-acetylneuraminate lyase
MTAPTTGKNGGLYCYLMTPYDDDGAVNHDALERYVDSVIEDGVDGLTCIASTCEGVYLTEDERFSVAETVCRVSNGRVPVNVGVGGFSTKQVIRYAEQAQKCGAASLMTDMQTYFPISFEAAKQHYAELAKSTSVPVRIYNITQPTHFDFTPERLLEMADIEAIDSMKESSGIATRVRDIRSLCGDRFAVFCGFHIVSLEVYKYGAVGWECGMHPLIVKDCVELHRTLRAGDFDTGTKLYERLVPLFLFFKYFGVPQALKAMSNWSDIKLGRPRPPLPELSSEQTARLKEIMEDLKLI